MSLISLELLQLVGLLDRNDRAADLALIPADVLLEKVKYYREARLRQFELGQSRTEQRELAALISSASASNEPKAILAAGFIYGRTYANDPLIRLGHEPSDNVQGFGELIATGQGSSADEAAVRTALHFFEMLAPLIRHGYLDILPLEELRTRPEQLPIYYSEDWFKSEVPSHLHDFVHASARVREVVPGEQGAFLILSRAPQSPTRGVQISFVDDEPTMRNPFYLLSEARVVERRDDGRILLEQVLDWDAPPSRQSFEHWIYQSINRTIINRLADLSSELQASSLLGANYLTESKFGTVLARCCNKSLSDLRRNCVSRSEIPVNVIA